MIKSFLNDVFYIFLFAIAKHNILTKKNLSKFETKQFFIIIFKFIKRILTKFYIIHTYNSFHQSPFKNKSQKTLTLLSNNQINEFIQLPVQVHNHRRYKKSGVGKSCILLQFLQKKFKFDHDSTIGVQFGSKVITTQRPIKLQIWDTAGQQTFKSITRSYYRGSIGVILVYDITSRQSFNNISKWLDQTKNYSNDKITMILIGNKSDLDYKRTVSYDEGFTLAKKMGMLFMQCSAKSGQNVDSLFISLTEAIQARIQKKQIDPKNQAIGIKLGSLETQQEIQKKKKQCC